MRLPVSQADLAAVTALTLLVLSIFWPHVVGQRLIVGTSDRLHTFLNVRLFQAEQLREHGRVPAWTDRMFMGAPLDGLHWMLPSLDPSTVLLAALPPERFLWVSGLISATHLLLAALAAFLLLRSYVDAVFPCAVGAGLYVCSVFAVHRISQVDAAFAVLILLPLGVWVLRQVRRGHVRGTALGLTVLVTLLVGATFLQEAAYTLMFWGAFALYRSAATRDVRPVAALAVAGLCGLLIASPRLVTVLEETRELARSLAFGAVCACEGLRWLHDGIFGRTPADVLALENNLNLHEGFQLYTSTLTPMVLVVGLGLVVVDWWRRTPTSSEAVRASRDLPFFAAWLGLAVVVLLVDDVRYALYVAFFRVDFSHTRIAVTALLPICLLTASVLARLLVRAQPIELVRVSWAMPVLGLALGGLLWQMVEPLGRLLTGTLIGLHDRLVLFPGLLATPTAILGEIGAVALLFGLLLTFRWLLRLASRRQSQGARAAFASLATYGVGSLMLWQAHDHAVEQLRGPSTETIPIPFAGNNGLTLPTGAPGPPDLDAIASLSERLETERFRSVVVSAPDGFPTYATPSERGHSAWVAQLWRLRLQEGYPTLSRRLADLPWPESSRSLRALSFPRAETLPWPLLAALNVKYAIIASPALLLNADQPAGESAGGALPSRFQVLENPLQPVPRAFFTRRIVPAQEVARVRPDRPPPDTDAAALALVPIGDQEQPAPSCGLVEPGRVEPPCDLDTEAAGPREIVVRWQPPAHPDARIAIDIATGTDRPHGSTVEVPAGVVQHVVAGLRPNTVYRVRVRTCYREICSVAGPVLQVTVGSSLSPDELDGQLPSDPLAESWVEGISAPQSFESQTDDVIQASFLQDTVSLALAPASTPRFLVLNELYHPRWRAYADAQELRILPTNAVMRGLLVPPGVSRVELRYLPFSRTWVAAVVVGVGLTVTVAGVLALGRLDRRLPVGGSCRA